MTGSPGRHQTSRLHGLTAEPREGIVVIRPTAHGMSAAGWPRRTASVCLMEGGQLYRGDSGGLLSLDDGELSTIEGSHELPHRLG